MNTQDNVNDSGYLEVGDGHQIYWEDWGNPTGIPVMSLHGGPGASFSDSHKAVFDPKKHHVIFHDQRGSGQSKPFASTEHNTTQDLISDIDLLRQKFNFESFHIAGGSWGSTLSLLYAIEHPERVRSLLIWGIYLVSQFENDWVNEGYPRFNFPAEWEKFISLVPEEHRKNGTSVMTYYAQQMRSDNEKRAQKYAAEWTIWEATLLSINYDSIAVKERAQTDPSTLSMALLETHYFLNGCFIPENYILDNITKIKHIPCAITQGRFDMCTPPIGAHNLAKAYGANARLTMVNSGHHRSDPEMMAGLQAAALRLR
jgi:proline iminopeptidase